MPPVPWGQMLEGGMKPSGRSERFRPLFPDIKATCFPSHLAESLCLADSTCEVGTAVLDVSLAANVSKAFPCPISEKSR